MARLPTPGADDGVWGAILNDFLSQVLADDGTLKAGTVGTNALQDTSVTNVKLSTSVQTTLSEAATAALMPDGGRRIWTRSTPPGPSDGVQEGDIWMGPEVTP